MTVAMIMERGSAPRLSAREVAIGTIRAVVAVLDMKLVSAQPTAKMTTSRTMGLGLEPRAPTMASAMRLPAPVVSSALARAREPPNSRTTFRSMDFRASFSEITPVSTRTMAPMQAETWILMPIFFSKIMARMTTTRTTRETICFQAGTPE